MGEFSDGLTLTRRTPLRSTTSYKLVSLRDRDDLGIELARVIAKYLHPADADMTLPVRAG
jgi:hypothetical protein